MTRQTSGDFHIIFIDESRIEEKQLTFVVGLIVPAQKILEICKKMDMVIKKYLGKKYSCSDGTVNLKHLRTTKYQESPFSKLSSKKRSGFTKRIYQILKDCACALICDIEMMKDYSSAIETGLYLVLERFFYFLRENDSLGIVVSDQPFNEKLSYKKKLVEQVRSSEYWGLEFQERIYQDMFFTRDEWDPLVQVTDLTAYTLSKYVRNCLNSISLSDLSEKHDFRYKLKKNPYFKAIMPLIRTSPQGKISGYGIKYI